MATPKWAPGTLYPPGSLVQPLTAPTPQAIPPTNANLQDGNVGWDLEVGLSIVSGFGYGGNNSIRLDPGNYGPRDAVNQLKANVNPGQVITARAMVQQGASAAGAAGGLVKLIWYDENDVVIKESVGFNVNSGSGGAWHQSTVTDAAPDGAAYVRLAGGLYRNSENQPVWIAAFSWNYVLQSPAGLIYKAVQPSAGYSDNVEPTWPPVNGQTVIDNEVIWEAVLLTRIVWKARPILVSGATEPEFPAADGEFVADNTISWEAVSRRVEDENCPNSRFVVIAASKIYAADGDIAPYSATVNPLDWTSKEDAGYLPVNLQTYGGNPITGLGLYRGNVVPMSAASSQVWQVDEDPAQTALIDAFPIGCEWHDTIAPVMNDMAFLTGEGVRSFGVAAGATNLATDDIGTPIDPLVQEEIAAAAQEPFAFYFPARGQYWLIFGAQAFVLSVIAGGKIKAWVRHEFPWVIDDYTIRGRDLFLRHGDEVSRITKDRESDEVVDLDLAEGKRAVPFDWVLWWPWLDLGALGDTKMLDGFDIVGSGRVEIEFGWNPNDPTAWTPAWEIVPDSLADEVLSVPVSSPSFSIRLTFHGSDTNRTSFEALNLYPIDDGARW